MDSRRGSARVSELPRFASERGSTPRACAGMRDQRFHRALSKRSAEAYGETAVPRDTENNRRRVASRNSTALAFHGERWSRLSRAWPVGENIERRRIPANSFGRGAWLQSARRALRARRADNRVDRKSVV